MKIRLTKQQKHDCRQAKMAHDLKGSGLYVYKNATSGTLQLPKAPNPKDPRSKNIPKNGTFVGDNYFMSMVKTHDLIFVEELQSPMSEKKLITEQPPIITAQGAVEYVEYDEEEEQFNEEMPDKKETLINEEAPKPKKKR